VKYEDSLTRTITSESSTIPGADDEISTTGSGDGGGGGNSSTIKENPDFNIAYREISERSEIGKGRFGTVYRAHWHGPVAIKEIEFADGLLSGQDDEIVRRINEEVANLRRTRHSNLILYLGACIEPDKCAVVMTLCRGISLFKTIHMETASVTKLTVDWIINTAIDIAQGMAYLHNKQMIHKDLRSKNVFIDGHKAVISDFGLYSITSLSQRSSTRRRQSQCLPLTKECLYYMAPELVRLIGQGDAAGQELDEAFSKLSDVYAFGTVLYEMFCKDFPFAAYPAETVLYMTGNSCKSLPPVAQIPKDFKVILLSCWSKEVGNRPSFSSLLETFRKVPRQVRLVRSPSHPLGIGSRLV
jgi:kinase suppressor of Ras 2